MNWLFDDQSTSGGWFLASVFLAAGQKRRSRQRGRMGPWGWGGWHGLDIWHVMKAKSRTRTYLKPLTSVVHYPFLMVDFLSKNHWLWMKSTHNVWPRPTKIFDHQNLKAEELALLFLLEVYVSIFTISIWNIVTSTFVEKAVVARVPCGIVLRMANNMKKTKNHDEWLLNIWSHLVTSLHKIHKY